MSSRVPEGFVLNRPSDDGRALGEQVARFADMAEAEQRKQFPNMRERCKTCAFRLGTIPNGCAPTLMDAMKCVLEFDGPGFDCHEDKTKACAGYMLLVAAAGPDGKPVRAPWEFSTEPEVIS